ncbi:cupin domain-containing protein [Vulcanisaeta thermophila]|uniref:cupin domain-containing protein n=1 Tax=Vulcanisaeta thermophila TaxID=867917 RepID=UPI000852D2A6|nr:cupin domain-containing protein [Vulcanisaeta thermophila]
MVEYKVIQDVVNVPQEPLGVRGAVGVFTQWLVSKADGSVRYAVRRQVVRPGGRAPLHRHAYAETFIFISGVGRMRVGDGEFDVGPGMVVFVNSNTPHALVNTGSVDLVVFTVISYEDDMSITVLE